MAVEFEDINDAARHEKAVTNVSEILHIPAETVENYLVLVDDGGEVLRAETDINEVEHVVALVMVFLEHITNLKVRLED